MNSKERFLSEIRYRRNMSWLFLFAMWFLGGIVIHLLFVVAFGSSLERLETYIYYGWAIGVFILADRSSRVQCPRCGKIAIHANHLISISYAHCRWCDYPNDNEDFEELDDPKASVEQSLNQYE